MSTQDYRHVRNPHLRQVLESEPATVTDARLETALIATCAAIVSDHSRQDVPSHALAERVAHHHRAEQAFIRDDRAGAVEALRALWTDRKITRKPVGP